MCHKNIPTKLNHQQQPGLPQILTLLSECHSSYQELQDQARFFPILNRPWVWSAAAVAHLFKGSMFCAFRDDVILSSNNWSFELLLPFYHLEPVCPVCSDPSHLQGIFAYTTASLDISFFPKPFCVNPRDGCALKFQYILSF